MGNVYLNQKERAVIDKWRERLEAGDLMREGQIIQHLDRLAEKNDRRYRGAPND